MATGVETVTGAMMQYSATLRSPEPVGTYHDALGAGDAVVADSIFEADGTVREPAGSSYTHAGEERAAWYAAILSDGSLPLRLGTVTDDGTTVVFEFEVEQWGSTRLAPQAGATVDERGPSGKLVSARIYDDVDPPAVLTAG